jgi:diaminopimelate epimerase
MDDRVVWKCGMWSERETSSSIGKNLYWEFSVTKKEIGMESIPFLVSSATGNTFAILDGIQILDWKALKNIQQEGCRSLIQQLCEIAQPEVDGAFILYASEDSSDCFEWDFYNRDGSPAEMCGNAARCAFDYLFEKWISKKEQGTLKTVVGKVFGRSLADGQIQVQWTPPSMQLQQLEVATSERKWQGFSIDTGVPHFLVEDNLSLEQARELRFHPQFADRGTNVTSVRIKNANQMEAWTYERGVEDRTLSCGTGAVAAAIFAQEKMQTNPSVFDVQMPGGCLRVHLLFEKNEVCLTSSVIRFSENRLPRSIYEKIVTEWSLHGTDNSLQKTKD